MQTISFKVTDGEALRIRQQARKERLSLSEFLRRRSAGTEPPSDRITRVRCELTGADILGPLAGEAPFNTETVRELLSDFP